jgi:hypothetical protein
VPGCQGWIYVPVPTENAASPANVGSPSALRAATTAAPTIEQRRHRRSTPASPELLTALRLAPRLPELTSPHLGNLLDKLRRLQEAGACYQQVCGSSPMTRKPIARWAISSPIFNRCEEAAICRRRLALRLRAASRPRALCRHHSARRYLSRQPRLVRLQLDPGGAGPGCTGRHLRPRAHARPAQRRHPDDARPSRADRHHPRRLRRPGPRPRPGGAPMRCATRVARDKHRLYRDQAASTAAHPISRAPLAGVEKTAAKVARKKRFAAPNASRLLAERRPLGAMKQVRRTRLRLGHCAIFRRRPAHAAPIIDTQAAARPSPALEFYAGMSCAPATVQ